MESERSKQTVYIVCSPEMRSAPPKKKCRQGGEEAREHGFAFPPLFSFSPLINVVSSPAFLCQRSKGDCLAPHARLTAVASSLHDFSTCGDQKHLLLSQ